MMNLTEHRYEREEERIDGESSASRELPELLSVRAGCLTHTVAAPPFKTATAMLLYLLSKSSCQTILPMLAYPTSFRAALRLPGYHQRSDLMPSSESGSGVPASYHHQIHPCFRTFILHSVRHTSSSSPLRIWIELQILRTKIRRIMEEAMASSCFSTIWWCSSRSCCSKKAAKALDAELIKLASLIPVHVQGSRKK